MKQLHTMREALDREYNKGLWAAILWHEMQYSLIVIEAAKVAPEEKEAYMDDAYKHREHIEQLKEYMRKVD